MPRAVREALTDILTEDDDNEQNQSVGDAVSVADGGTRSRRDKAEEMLRDMEKTGRYFQETW